MIILENMRWTNECSFKAKSLRRLKGVVHMENRKALHEEKQEGLQDSLM